VTTEQVSCGSSHHHIVSGVNSTLPISSRLSSSMSIGGGGGGYTSTSSISPAAIPTGAIITTTTNNGFVSSPSSSSSTTATAGLEDVVRAGWLKKWKGSKKYFVLRKETDSDKPARLEYYASDKLFRMGKPPKK
jgi:hypothetical protein